MSEPATAAESAARGRAARASAPRSSHAAWQPEARRSDPIELLERQALTRVPELVPIRYGRMLASPFAFFRGGAAIMAADLADTPVSGLRVQLCGDAHLSNFGGFAAPDRRLVFDVNDFDETLPGPWEWDVKRLAASVAVAARERSIADDIRRRIVTASVSAYRKTMSSLAAMGNLDVFYARVEADAVIERLRARGAAKAATRVERDIGRAQHKDSLRALKKLSVTVDGQPRIVSDPPLVVPVRDLVSPAEGERLIAAIRTVMGSYAASLRPDVRQIRDSYEVVDMARKVVGVGSVGTRAWIVLLIGRDKSDPLFLQAKEAQASVLEPLVSRSVFRHHGRRVVEGQRLLQPASDVLLGWTRGAEIDDQERDYYVRQLWDWKLSLDIATMRPNELEDYAGLCGGTLARGHARSGDRIAIASYLGSAQTFDAAIADFAETYADQNERDYAELVAAVKSGRVEARTGV